ncbi:hypothetical protein KFE25_002653 [Diacronema lutheri]|uniref:Nascent polypeptide-associated complex subunit alpha-like UBA domain-containing protein n=1 Tax=Diacronema lutheri TaxID=2081491 RepID=A0A8J5XHI3_DIALT|nr:hypothetical protein KFE25_002653 [Diacronema lutheri]
MAAEGEVVDEQETEAKAKGEGGKQNKDLDTVTDYVEAREMDASKAQQAMAAMLGSGEASEDSLADAARERELAAVTIDQADVAVLMAEFEVDKAAAERKLREQRGDLTAALTAMLAS